jgi:hypothetical protein
MVLVPVSEGNAARDAEPLESGFLLIDQKLLFAMARMNCSGPEGMNMSRGDAAASPVVAGR